MLIRLLQSLFFKNKEKIVNNIKCKINKKEVVPEPCKEYTQEEKYDLVDLSIYNKPIFENTYDPNKKTLVMVDDIRATKVLYDIALKNIERNTGTNILEKYNIIYFLGNNIGFSFLHFIRTSDIKIDYVIFDITINTVASIRDADNHDLRDIDPLEVDGVDLAIELDKINKDCKIMFNSAHSMNPRNPMVSSFMAKFKNHFNTDIRNYSIDKISNLAEPIEKLLKR